MDNPARNHRLRLERIGHNWRQRDLAEQLGTTVVTIKRWEKGYQQPSMYFQAKLCILFGKSAEELGLAEKGPAQTTTRPQDGSETQPAEDYALWTIPHPRNPHFTGREDLLEQLALRLSPSEPTSMRRAVLTQPEAIKGLGGIGKTQLAVEYAYRAREQDRYTHVLWINAASEETILSSFAALAELLPSVAAHDEKDRRKVVATLIHWLEEYPHPWLLIFDNADDLSLAQQFFPHRGHGSLLLTTRAHAVAALASSLEVEPLGLIEGTTFLLQRSQRLEISDEERDEATNVVIALDGFPLALDQAGAYIEETGCDFKDYLRLYRDHRHTLLARRGNQAMHYPDSVATTWSLSFQQVEQTSPAAADLLRLCAFLAPDHIPEELLREGAAHWPSPLQQAVTDLFSFNQILEALLKYSLIKRLTEKHMLSIHRLVQVVQRERMDPREQLHWASCVVYGVNAVFPGEPRYEIATWPRCQRYLEQVQNCDLLIRQYDLKFSEAADVLNRAGIYLCEHALYALAEPLFQRARHIWEQRFGAEHVQAAEPLYELAELYRRQSKFAEAEALFQRVLQIREQQLGSEHPKVAAARSSMALLYSGQGRYAEAEPLFLRALHILEQQLGPEHPQVAWPLNNLANLYVNQARYAQAEPLYQRALHIWEQQLGADHPNVAYLLNNLAIMYYYQGRFVEAEPLYWRTLHIREQQYGPDHEKVAYPLNNLGDFYVEMGNYAAAEPLLLRALHIREQQLGPEHDAVAYPLNNLAKLYAQQGKYAEAEQLHRRALRIWEQTLGTEHPQIVDVLNGLASLFQVQGKYANAESLYLRALAIREQRLGPEHPDTVASRNNLAALQHARDKTIFSPSTANLSD